MGKNSILLALAIPILFQGYLESRRLIVQNFTPKVDDNRDIPAIKQALTRDRDSAAHVEQLEELWRAGMRMQQGSPTNVPAHFQDLAQAVQAHGKMHADVRRFANCIRDGQSSELPENEELQSLLSERASVRREERDIKVRLNQFESGGSGRRDTLLDRLERYRIMPGSDDGFYATCMARIAFCDVQRAYPEPSLQEVHQQFRSWARGSETSLPEANRLREGVAAWQTYLSAHAADSAKTEKAATQLAEWKNARLLLGILQGARQPVHSAAVQQLSRLGELLKDESVSARCRDTIQCIVVKLCEDVLPLKKPLDVKVLIHARGAEAPKEIDKSRVVIVWRNKSPTRQHLIQSNVHDGITLEEQNENECTIDLSEVESLVVDGAILDHSDDPARKLLAPTLRSEAIHRYKLLRKELKFTAGALREFQTQCAADRRLEPELRKAGLSQRINELVDVAAEHTNLFPESD